MLHSVDGQIHGGVLIKDVELGWRQ